MKTKRLNAILLLFALPMWTFAQNGQADSVTHEKQSKLLSALSRLSIGGYGEAIFSRNFYSDSPFKYNSPEAHRNDPSHGRFDIPHAVIYLGYDFGKGWTFNTEIEFEHGGSGSAVEKEGEEGGEWETETEKGGEVELEQFWIQKSFCPAFNIRAGHIIVPVGLTNAHHEPLNFFTCYRAEGENNVLPCTWHRNGISLWGRAGDWRYEAQVTSGLDAMMFNRTNWVKYGSHSPYEFEVANRYGFAARVDNYSVRGLRLGLSAYYGKTMNNTYPNDTKKYEHVSGALWIASLDFTYKGHNWIARGYADYGHLSDVADIYELKSLNKTAPYKRSDMGEKAFALSVEAGYDIFSQVRSLRGKQHLYVFGHAEHYDSYVSCITPYTQKTILAAGINYMPIRQIAVKAEYNHRMMKKPYNDEPSLNVGIVYQGFFL